MSKRIIPESELLWNFVTSSGPGGQNVNKTATKAQLRWHLASSTSLSDEEKAKLTTRLRHFITDDGYVAINCDQTRSQSQNKELALKRLTELVNLSLQPIKVRRPTKPTATAKRQRLQTKKHRGQIKRNRQIKTTDLD